MGSWLGSIFTPGGTNARQGQEADQGAASRYASDLLGPYSKLINMQLNSQIANEPAMEQSIRDLLGLTTQAGRNGLIASERGQLRGNAMSQAGAGNSLFAGNPSLQAANQLDRMNSANNAGNNFSMQVNSPQGQAQAFQIASGAYGAGRPDLGGFSSLIGDVYGRPPVAVGKGLGDFLGPIAGSWAGGGFQ